MSANAFLLVLVGVAGGFLAGYNLSYWIDSKISRPMHRIEELGMSSALLLSKTNPLFEHVADSTSGRKFTSFADIFNLTGTDKLYRHAYDRYYDVWFDRFISKPNLRLLEIGADSGKSLSAWGMFFEHAPVVHGLSYGISPDYNYTNVACKVDSSSCAKIRIFYGDQVGGRDNQACAIML
jgi:hypothetical protein